MHLIILSHLIHIFVNKKTTHSNVEKRIILLFLANTNNYNPNQQGQTYVVAQGRFNFYLNFKSISLI